MNILKLEPTYLENVGEAKWRRKSVAQELHPFDKLCHRCVLNDCSTSSIGCLQHRVVGYDVKDRRFDPEILSEMMVRAGLARFLGADLVIKHGLLDVVTKYRQVGIEEFCDEARGVKR